MLCNQIILGNDQAKGQRTTHMVTTFILTSLTHLWILCCLTPTLLHLCSWWPYVWLRFVFSGSYRTNPWIIAKIGAKTKRKEWLTLGNHGFTDRSIKLKVFQESFSKVHPLKNTQVSNSGSPNRLTLFYNAHWLKFSHKYDNHARAFNFVTLFL